MSKRSVPPPKRLLHFTDYQGLLGILDGPSIWLSRARSLNDTMEVEHGLGVAARCIEAQLEGAKYELEREVLKEALRIVKTGHQNLAADKLPFIDPHVAAFCGPEGADNLLHWAMYGRNGDGFAVVFDGENLRSREIELDLVKVQYDESEQVREMEAGLGYFVRAAQRPAGQEQLKKQRSRPGYVGAQCGYTLTALAAAMKHRNFKEENERRLLIHYRPTDIPDTLLRFRVSRNAIVPYYVVPFPKESVVEVIMGSKVDERLNQPAIERLLRERSYGKVPVRKTTLSLR